MNYIEKYKLWCQSPAVDEATKEELRAIANNEDEIKLRFSADLSFGTAGLRGVMRAGTDAMTAIPSAEPRRGSQSAFWMRARRQPGAALLFAMTAATIPRNLPVFAHKFSVQTALRSIFSMKCALPPCSPLPCCT